MFDTFLTIFMLAKHRLFKKIPDYQTYENRNTYRLQQLSSLLATTHADRVALLLDKEQNLTKNLDLCGVVDDECTPKEIESALQQQYNFCTRIHEILKDTPPYAQMPSFQSRYYRSLLQSMPYICRNILSSFQRLKQEKVSLSTLESYIHTDTQSLKLFIEVLVKKGYLKLEHNMLSIVHPELGSYLMTKNTVVSHAHNYHKDDTAILHSLQSWQEVYASLLLLSQNTTEYSERYTPALEVK